MCCEAIPRQVNFLIDEGVLTGKCASSTISCIHYFFEWHGLAETFTQIHVHNCRAQNKNNALIDVVLPLDRSPCFGEWWPGYVELFNSGTCEICTRLVLRTCPAKNKENVYFITIWYSKGSRSRIRRLERLRFTFTPNGKREFAPRDQVFPLFFVYRLLLLHKNK